MAEGTTRNESVNISSKKKRKKKKKKKQNKQVDATRTTMHLYIMVQKESIDSHNFHNTIHRGVC